MLEVTARARAAGPQGTGPLPPASRRLAPAAHSI